MKKIETVTELLEKINNHHPKTIKNVYKIAKSLIIRMSREDIKKSFIATLGLMYINFTVNKKKKLELEKHTIIIEKELQKEKEFINWVFDNYLLMRLNEDLLLNEVITKNLRKEFNAHKLKQ